MCKKIRIIVIVLVLEVIFVGKLIVLSDQSPNQTSNTQTKQAQNASPRPATDQTTNTQTKSAQDSVDKKNNVQPDTTKENTSTGGGINYLNVCLGLGGIGTFLFGLTALLKFIWKARSKVDISYSAEDIDKRDIADRLDKIQKAIEQNPKASLIEKAIADAYMLQRGERIEEAIEKWRSIANITEGNDNRLASRSLASVGYLCVKEGKGEHALLALNKAIDLEPDFVEAYNNRGAVKNFLRRHKDALADYDIAIRLKPDYAEAYGNRGTTKNLLGKHQDALADYDTAIRLKSDYAEAYYYRGHANSALEKYDAALADYSTAIKLRLDNPAAYNNRGFIHFKLGQCRKAITDYNEAIRLKSDEMRVPDIQGNSISFLLESTEFNEAEVYMNRGVAKSQLGEYEEALADYSKAIQLKPDYAEAYYHRGLTNTLLEKHQDSLTDYNEAIRLKPGYVEAYSN